MAKTREKSGKAQDGLHTVSRMKKKYGKFYADWRDEHGARHAKAFPSARAARKYTAKMRKECAAKKARASAKSRTTSRRSKKHSTAAATPGMPSKSYAAKRAISPRGN